MSRISSIHVDPAILLLLPSEKHLILRKPKLRISLPGEKATLKLQQTPRNFLRGGLGGEESANAADVGG